MSRETLLPQVYVYNNYHSIVTVLLTEGFSGYHCLFVGLSSIFGLCLVFLFSVIVVFIAEET